MGTPLNSGTYVRSAHLRLQRCLLAPRAVAPILWEFASVPLRRCAPRFLRIAAGVELHLPTYAYIKRTFITAKRWKIDFYKAAAAAQIFYLPRVPFRCASGNPRLPLRRRRRDVMYGVPVHPWLVTWTFYSVSTIDNHNNKL